MVSQKDVAANGHSVGELVMSPRPLVSWAEDLATTDDERGYGPPYVGNSGMQPLGAILRICQP